MSIAKYQERHPQDVSRYANATWRPWSFLLNQHARYVQFKFDIWNLANDGDYLSLAHNAGTQTFYANTIPYVPYDTGPWVPLGYGAAGNKRRFDFQWTTNDSGVGLGYRMNELFVLCEANSTTTNNQAVQFNRPYDGYLLGDGDVIYLYVVQPAWREIGIVLWPEASNDDFDIFASFTNQRPSSSSWDYRSVQAAGNPEFIVIPAPTASRYVWIAVGSYSGEGQFRFYANVHDNSYPSTVTAITDFAPTTGQKAQIRRQMVKMQQAVYFASDGRHLIKSFDMTWNAAHPSGVHLQWHNKQGPNMCGAPATYCNWVDPVSYVNYEPKAWCGCATNCTANPVPIPADCLPSKTTDAANHQWAGITAIHEFGHCYYRHLDEYHATGNCGHSSMGSPDYYAAHGPDFCAFRNGGKDPAPGTTGHVQSQNGWSCMESHFAHYVPRGSTLTADVFYRTELQDFFGAFRSQLTIVEH